MSISPILNDHCVAYSNPVPPSTPVPRIENGVYDVAGRYIHNDIAMAKKNAGMAHNVSSGMPLCLSL